MKKTKGQKSRDPLPTEKEEFRNGGIQEKMDTGKEGHRKRGTQEKRDTGMEGFGAGVILDCRDSA